MKDLLRYQEQIKDILQSKCFGNLEQESNILFYKNSINISTKSSNIKFRNNKCSNKYLATYDTLQQAKNINNIEFIKVSSSLQEGNNFKLTLNNKNDNSNKDLSKLVTDCKNLQDKIVNIVLSNLPVNIVCEDYVFNNNKQELKIMIRDKILKTNKDIKPLIRNYYLNYDNLNSLENKLNFSTRDGKDFKLVKHL